MQTERSSTHFQNHISLNSLLNSTNLICTPATFKFWLDKNTISHENAINEPLKTVCNNLKQNWNTAAQKTAFASIMRNNKNSTDKSFNLLSKESQSSNSNSPSIFDKNIVSPIVKSITEANNSCYNSSVFPPAIAHFQQLLQASNLQQFYSMIQQQQMMNQFMNTNNIDNMIKHPVSPSTSSGELNLISPNSNNNGNIFINNFIIY